MNKLFSTNTYPPEQREQTDSFCIFIFTLILVFFFGVGGYIIIEGVHSYKNNSVAIDQ